MINGDLEGGTGGMHEGGEDMGERVRRTDRQTDGRRAEDRGSKISRRGGSARAAAGVAVPALQTLSAHRRPACMNA